MSEPKTRPDEISRAARDEMSFRIETLTTLARIEALFDAHTREDDRRFSEINEWKRAQATIVSGVNTDRDRARGMIGMLGWLAAAASIIGNWLISWFHK